MFSYVYSSNTHAWSVTSLADLPDDILHESSRGALARNALYFMLRDETYVLKYDLATSIISQIAVPQRPDGRSLLLMTMEDGGLGFADVDFFGHDLRLWAMEDDHPEGVGWILRTVISLSEHLPPRALRSSPDAVAFAEVAGVIFLSTSDGLYTFDLKTRKGNRIMSNRFYDIVPYVSFYTPGTTTCPLLFFFLLALYRFEQYLPFIVVADEIGPIFAWNLFILYCICYGHTLNASTLILCYGMGSTLLHSLMLVYVIKEHRSISDVF